MTAARSDEELRDGGRSSTRVDFEVAARSSSIGEARHSVSAFLTAHAMPSVVVDDLALVTSELVTNAVLHPPNSDHPVRIQVSVGPTVTVEVANHGSATGMPPIEQWQAAPPTERSGRGLGIVRRLCDEVAVRQDGTWTVVTCGRRVPDAGGRR